jgi:hypothetical protein
MVVHEEPSEFVRLYDPCSQSFIICANRNHCNDPSWIHSFISKEQDKVTLIDVTQSPPNAKAEDTMAFTHDSFVDANQVLRYSKMLVDYCCEIHRALMSGNKVVVFCRNGRSRSPCVILAFFLMRGMSRDHAVEYLTLAFQLQRPTITSISINFRKINDKYFRPTVCGANILTLLDTLCSFFCFYYFI